MIRSRSSTAAMMRLVAYAYLWRRCATRKWTVPGLRTRNRKHATWTNAWSTTEAVRKSASICRTRSAVPASPATSSSTTTHVTVCIVIFFIFFLLISSLSTSFYIVYNVQIQPSVLIVSLGSGVLFNYKRSSDIFHSTYPYLFISPSWLGIELIDRWSPLNTWLFGAKVNYSYEAARSTLRNLLYTQWGILYQ